MTTRCLSGCYHRYRPSTTMAQLFQMESTSFIHCLNLCIFCCSYPTTLTVYFLVDYVWTNWLTDPSSLHRDCICRSGPSEWRSCPWSCSNWTFPSIHENITTRNWVQNWSCNSRHHFTCWNPYLASSFTYVVISTIDADESSWAGISLSLPPSTTSCTWSRSSRWRTERWQRTACQEQLS